MVKASLLEAPTKKKVIYIPPRGLGHAVMLDEAEAKKVTEIDRRTVQRLKYRNGKN